MSSSIAHRASRGFHVVLESLPSVHLLHASYARELYDINDDKPHKAH